MCEEDCTLSVEKNSETGELIVSGQGEIHIEILAKKLKSRYGIDVILSEPKIPYRETIKAVATAEGKHKKQSGGHGQYGHCKVRFEPCESEFEFGDEVVAAPFPNSTSPPLKRAAGSLRPRRAGGLPGGVPEGHPGGRLLSPGRLL